jgi:hypothetical protein
MFKRESRGCTTIGGERVVGLDFDILASKRSQTGTVLTNRCKATTLISLVKVSADLGVSIVELNVSSGSLAYRRG